VQPNDQLSLDIQIYRAHTDMNKKKVEHHSIESMRKPIFAQRVLAILDGDSRTSISKATTVVTASEDNVTYLRGLNVAYNEMVTAEAKYEYLCNLAKTQRDEGFNERLAAKL
jgi:hypothetical protein